MTNLNDEECYVKAVNYWSNVNPTIDGMLGGFAHISDIDLQTSNKFLSQFYLPISKINTLPVKQAAEQRATQIRALDCGAGIGRISKNLLLKFFDKVDLLDNNENFLKEARNFIGPDVFDTKCSSIYTSLHTFMPIEGVQYDVIWIQWVTGHLTDSHFVDFLEKCKKILNPHGFLILKDNHTSNNENDIDTQDGSVTRSYTEIIRLIRLSGYEVIDQKRTQFPKVGIYPVKMFCLKPINIQTALN